MSDSFVNPWTVACKASLSMGFSWREYWSGLLFPTPRDLPNPWVEPRSPALQADSLSEPPGKLCLKANLNVHCIYQLLSHVQLFTTPWTVACQSLLSLGFSRHEYWSGLLFPTPGDIPDPGVEPASSALAGRIYIYIYFFFFFWPLIPLGSLTSWRQAP